VTDEPCKSQECQASGHFLDGCRIDLPPDDVVEEIEFERFFRLGHLAFGALRATDAPDPDGGAGPPVDINTMQVALYMPFTQQWTLDGYARGRIVNSFSLGPGEEQTVEVFTWDRTTSALESSTAFEAEQTTESSGSRRDTADVKHDMSRQAGLELTSGGKVGFKVGVVNVDASAGMTARAGINDAQATTMTSIVDATSRATGHIRTSRTLKVTESRESGREERVTRKLRNANECHALTVAFFEVLAKYRVATFVRTNQVRLVVLIPSSLLTDLPSFDREMVRIHETTLRLELLDRALAPGFDAARFLDSRDRACGVLCHGCSCGDDDSGDTRSDAWDAVVAAAQKIAVAAATVASTPILFPASIAFALPPLFAQYPTLLADIRRWLFKKALANNAPRLLADVGAIGIAPAPASVSLSQAKALASILAGITVPLLAFDPKVTTSAWNDIVAALQIAMPLAGIPNPIPFDPYWILAQVPAGKISGDTGGLTQYTDEGLVSAINAFSAAYKVWLDLQAAERDKDAKRKELDRIAKEERDLRITQTYGLRETADAEERLEALLAHLNDGPNLDHYRFAVWNERSGAADDVVTLFAMGGFIDPTPVGIVENQLAVPIRLEHEARWSAFFAENVADLVDHTIRDEQPHILPTAALYAEAVIGECCGCEDTIVEKRQLEADQVRLGNELLRLETRRLNARLKAKPPLLDKELPAPVGLCLRCGGHHGEGGETASSSGASSRED